MCGIFGAIGRDISAELAGELQRGLAHRGPDDRGVARFDGGAFVHCRLAIIDLGSTGHQPMRSADGSTVITYNGEIYNYRELRQELEADYPFEGRSDTEVILAAYARWGVDCLTRLRGMFAFGLWDAIERRLLCATDRLSIKPLLYHRDTSGLLFASEVRPLVAAGVRVRPNRRRMYDYLRFGLLDHTDETLFDGIHQLRPGTYLVADDRHTQVCRYWDLTDGDDEWRGEATVDEIAATLDDAVDLHLRGDVEPALSLSSGLDSRVLRALIERRGLGRLRCFTYCFTGTPYDECARVGPTVADSTLRHHRTEVEPTGLFDGLARLVTGLEGPAGGLGIYGYWRNSQRVQREGLKVLLDGQGADEAFAGYKYYYHLKLGALAAAGASETLARELDAYNAAHDEALTVPSDAFDRLVARDGDLPVIKAPDGTSLASEFLGAEFARAAAYAPAPLPRPFRCPVKTAMYRDLFFLKIPKLLRFQDRCAMAWGVEVRVPYLDHVLLERMVRVPTDVLVAGGVTKALLRRIAGRRGIEIPAGPKLYVSAPQREWIKTIWRRDILAMIAESHLAADGYVDAAALAAQYEAYCQSPALGNSFFVWKFINLELWYRTFIVSRPPRAAVGAQRHA